MSGRARETAPSVSCGDLELRFALEIPDMVRGLHWAKIEEVRLSHPHTIAYCDEQPIGGVCLPYALGLLGDPAYEDIMTTAIGLTGPFVGTDLANWLLDGHLTELNGPDEGALVFYFRYELWAHAGKVVQRGRVQSKWGQFPAYQHKTWEVPCRYGDSVRYFEMPQRSLFEEYAAAQGISQWDLLG